MLDDCNTKETPEHKGNPCSGYENLVHESSKRPNHSRRRGACATRDQRRLVAPSARAQPAASRSWPCFSSPVEPSQE